MLRHLGLRNIVPDRDYHLRTRYGFLGKETVELGLRPSLGEEMGTQNHNSKAGAYETSVDTLP